MLTAAPHPQPEIRPHRCVRRWLPAALLAAALLLQGCATTTQTELNGFGGSSGQSGQSGQCSSGVDDPLEAWNRQVFAFNLALDRAVIKPVAKTYRFLLPEFIRNRIRAVVDNLKEPLTFINELLQARGSAAAITGQRFVVNSTLGLAGLFDRATGLGLAAQSGDFGQTLYRWGVADGPYLVLPLFGPSTFRDSVGLGVDFYASPVGHVGSADVRRELAISTGAADGIDLRSRNIENFDEVEANSLDFYAYLRSVTRQQRQAVLREANTGPSAARPPADELVDPGESAAPAPVPAMPSSAASSASSELTSRPAAAGC